MRHWLLLGLLSLAGCVGAPPASAPVRPEQASRAFVPMSILVFGDHGYDLDYLAEDERLPARTHEQAVALQQEEWLEDKRPRNEFKPSALTILPSTGGYVDASGMMPVARAMTSYCQAHRCDAARADFGDVFAVVGMHLHDAAHALGLLACRVVDAGARLEHAGVHAEVRHAPHVRVGDDLEG